MKAVKIVLALFAVGLLFSACTKTVYETAPIAADTGKPQVVCIIDHADSACDIYINGNLYTTMFAYQVYDTLRIPSGSVMQAQWEYNNELFTVADTASIKDTTGSYMLSCSGDTLNWVIW